MARVARAILAMEGIVEMSSEKVRIQLLAQLGFVADRIKMPLMSWRFEDEEKDGHHVLYESPVHPLSRISSRASKRTVEASHAFPSWPSPLSQNSMLPLSQSYQRPYLDHKAKSTNLPRGLHARFSRSPGSALRLAGDSASLLERVGSACACRAA